MNPMVTHAAVSGASPSWDRASVAAGVLFLSLVVASVVIFKTRNGTIVFENLPEKAVVTVDGDAMTVEWPDGEGQGRARITLAPGKHAVQIPVNGVRVTGEVVGVESGGVKPFVVRIEPRPVTAEHKCEPPLDQDSSRNRSRIRWV